MRTLRTPPRHRARRWRAHLLLVPLVLALALGACGSNDGDSGSTSAAAGAGGAQTTGADPAVAKAQAAVAEAKKPITSIQLPSGSPGPLQRGKKVVAITCQNTAPLCLHAAQSVQRAGSLLGWQTQIVDGQGNPQAWTNAINTALTSGADAIVMASAIPALVPEAIAAAKAKGVPVVTILTCLDRAPDGVVNQIESDRFATGHVLGDYVVANAPEGAEVGALALDAFPCLKRASDGFKAALQEAGPAWKVVAEQTSPLSEIASPAGAQRITSILRANPDVSYFWAMSESWAASFERGAQAANRGEVTGLGIDSDFFLPQVREGANFVQAGPNTQVYGYYVVDALLRWFNRKPQQRASIPFRLVDKENAQEIEGDTIPMDVDVAAKFKQLWGLG